MRPCETLRKLRFCSQDSLLLSEHYFLLFQHFDNSISNIFAQVKREGFACETRGFKSLRSDHSRFCENSNIINVFKGLIAF